MIPEQIAAATIEACARMVEELVPGAAKDGSLMYWLSRRAQELRDNRTTIIASITIPEEGIGE